MAEIRDSQIQNPAILQPGDVVVDEASEYAIRLRQFHRSKQLSAGMDDRLKATLKRYRGGTLVEGSIGIDPAAMIILLAKIFAVLTGLIAASIAVQWYLNHGKPSAPSSLGWLLAVLGLNLVLFIVNSKQGKTLARKRDGVLLGFLRSHLDPEDRMR